MAVERVTRVRDALAAAPAALRDAITRHARYSVAQPWDELSSRQVFQCVGLAIRDLMIDGLLQTQQRQRRADAKYVYYLSMEYLLGRSLANNLSNLGVYDLCRDTLQDLGADLADVEESERDAALGNGGLGRLAASIETAQKIFSRLSRSFAKSPSASMLILK